MKNKLLFSLVIASVVAAAAALPAGAAPKEARGSLKKPAEPKSTGEYRGVPASIDLNEKGVAQIRARDFRIAEDTFKKALNADPNNITAAFNLASAYLINKKEEAAITLLTTYTAKAPDDAGLFVRLGDAYFGTKQVEKALKAYESAYKLDPEFAELAGKLATVHILNGNPEKAEKMLEQAVEAKPRDSTQLANLASLYVGNGKIDQAIAVSKKALQIKATKEVYITLATAYELKKDYKNALISFQRAADLGDNRPEVLKKIAGLKKVAS